MSVFSDVAAVRPEGKHGYYDLAGQLFCDGRESAPTPLSDVEGEIPAELLGTFYVNGVGRASVGGHKNVHPFDGDGLICAFRFDQGGATYASRFVRTPWFEREQAAGRRLYPVLGTPVPGGPWRNFPGFGRQKNPLNVAIQPFGDHLIALSDMTRPFRIDPATLETLGEEDFGGGLPPGAMFCAHMRSVAGSDLRVGFTLNYASLRPTIDIFETGPTTPARKIGSARLDGYPFLHDIAATPRHVVAIAGSYRLDPFKLPGWLVGRRTLMSCLIWDARAPMRAYVFDRTDRRRVREYVLGPGMILHVANGFDDGDDVVVDAGVFDDPTFITRVFPAMTDPSKRPASHGRLARMKRLRFRPDGRAEVKTLHADGIEFPATLPEEAGKPYRWLVGMDLDDPRQVARLDTGTGDLKLLDFGPAHFMAEPVVVPGARPDEGWVLSVGYDGRRRRSFVAIMGLHDFPRQHARVWLPFVVPFRFHGSFLGDSPALALGRTPLLA